MPPLDIDIEIHEATDTKYECLLWFFRLQSKGRKPSNNSKLKAVGPGELLNVKANVNHGYS